MGANGQQDRLAWVLLVGLQAIRQQPFLLVKLEFVHENA